MKKYFSKAGVPVVPGMVVKAEKDIEKAVKTIGFPMIAKPDNGVGASGTFKLTKKLIWRALKRIGMDKQLISLRNLSTQALSQPMMDWWIAREMLFSKQV